MDGGASSGGGAAGGGIGDGAPLIEFVATGADAVALATSQPHTVDAVLVFDGAADGAAVAGPGSDVAAAAGGGVRQHRGGSSDAAAAVGTWGTVDALDGGNAGSSAGVTAGRPTAAGGGEQQDPERERLQAALWAALPPGLAQLSRYRIHMNHTDVPPTRFLLDLFDAWPAKGNGLALYRR